MLKDSNLIQNIPPPAEDPSDRESPEVWGFADTRFRVNERGHVELTGSRYALCEAELPYLLPWVRQVMELDVETSDPLPSAYPPNIPEPVTHPEFLSQVQKVLTKGQWTLDPQKRLRHGHGHTQAEMFAIKHGKISRVPDMVVYPASEEQVVALVEAAGRLDVCLIPYGGGTCVTEALLCPENEKRMIVSVDMGRMNRILWIDPVNQLACIEAGAVGRQIVSQLAQYGFTLGHEPDSVEFSTLGGWVATNASGMKKNKYGNIEDLVLDINVVTAEGQLKRRGICPRESVGLDPRKMMFGSEGNLGIITQAVVKVFPLPEVQKYGSILFPDFERGVNFLYELTRKGTPPASIRLVDNLQFQFGLALKHAPRGFKALKSKVEKWVVTKLKGFDPQKMVACTLVLEGTREEVARQEKQIYRLAKKYRGLKAGAENGRRGYQLTFSIAYIRDFVMNYYLLAESFETSVPWSQALSLCERVKARLYEEHRRRNLPGKPFVTCRVTQVYQTGVCVYFYFGYYFKGVKHPSEVFAEMETAAREEILKCGGSLSHHHGIGKLRTAFLKDIKSPATLSFNQKAKAAVDPRNIFGGGNQGLGGDETRADAKTAVGH